MKIPYGLSNFATIRKEGFFYVDKTPFLPLLESGELGYRYLMFLRPRRMGKSSLLSMLEHYYDLHRAAEFDALFGGLWVHEHPTPERSSYWVLSLDFSRVGADRGVETLLFTFYRAVRDAVERLVARYRERFPALGRLSEQLDDLQEPETLMGALITAALTSDQKLYVLIDEYDTFANALLSSGDQDLYANVTDKTGFVRSFYRTLKTGTGSGAVGRIFITGVSPVLLDDLMSGFNIVKHTSWRPQFNALAGFTRTDVERAVAELLAARPDLRAIPEIGDPTVLLQVLEQYYDGYRFSADATERVFNSDMVLYFLSELADGSKYPTQMLDMNARTDYGKLRRLWTAAGPAGAARREILRLILEQGYIESAIVERFGAGSLSLRAQFASLLYYQGMLTLAPEPPAAGQYRLEIPNRVIRELQWEHLALMLKEQDHIDIDTNELTQTLLVMTRHGNIQPLVDLFRARAIQAMGVKDFRRFDEKSLKLMLLAFLSVSRVFHVLSEKEFAQGYCDLFLGPSGLVPDAKYAWLLEIKYLKATAKAKEIENDFAEADVQLKRYSADPRLVPMLTQGKELKAGTLVFVSGKDVLFEPWPREKKRQKAAPSSRAPRRAAKGRKGRTR